MKQLLEQHKNLLIIAALTIGIGLLIYHARPSAHAIDDSHPDAFMTDVDMIQMDKTGIPESRLKTPRMTHYTQDDKTKVSKPYILVTSDSGKPWEVSAEDGIATQGTHMINLSNNVQVYQAASKENPETTLLTSQLTLFPKRKFAHTDESVTIKQPGTLVTATGMRAFLDEERVQLLANVKEQHEPSNAE